MAQGYPLTRPPDHCLSLLFDARPVPNFGTIESGEAGGRLAVHWQANPADLHALLLYPEGYDLPPVYAAINIPDSDVRAGNTVVPYPPFLRTGAYVVELLRQVERLPPILEEELDEALRDAEPICMTEFYVGLPPPPRLPPKRSRPQRGGVPLRSYAPVREEGGPPGEPPPFCRCVLHVAARQPLACLRGSQRIGRTVEGKRCYNPYAVCTVSTKRPTRCEQYYTLKRLEELPDRELAAYAVLRRIPVAEPISRAQVLGAVRRWRRSKGLD